ncbi:hypothetical protein GJ496_004203 [Pomphorhynchus laevis]|nr:hypothetical protein GJ496_004203 [Pomphorhynchus laevis]
MIFNRLFSTTSLKLSLINRSRVEIVDNSRLALEGMLYKRRPIIINVYNEQNSASIGDRVLLALCGRMCKAIVVGCKGYFHKPGRARFDSSYVVLIDNDNNPLGTRIIKPISSVLRKNPKMAKIVSMATLFV